MIEALMYITIGAFIGWNLPQPDWAKQFQTKIINYIKGIGK
jgi:hypothetical protein